MQLALSGAALVRQPARAGSGGWAGRVTVAGSCQSTLEPLGQPLECELAVARLRTLVLRHRHQPRPGARQDAISLILAQRRRGEHVEDRFHAGGGDVSVLAARSR